VFPAGCDESMIAGSFKFGAVVEISAVNLIRALSDDRAYEKASSAVMGFIGELSAYNSREKSSICHKQTLTRLIDRL